MTTCSDCGRTVAFFASSGGRCIACASAEKQRELSGATKPPPKSIPQTEQTESDAELASIILTTESAPGLSVQKRLDIVTAEFAVGMGLLTDIFNAWRDVFGGRSKSYQNALKDARRAVLLELRREAHLVGADAVLGVSLDYSEISGGGKSMLFLVASGTAVKLAPRA